MTAQYGFCCHRTKWMTFYSESYGSLDSRAFSFHIFSSTFLTLYFSMFFICYFSTGIQVLQGTWASCLLARLWLLFGHVIELLVCWNGIIRMIILTTCSSAAALLKSLAKRCSKRWGLLKWHLILCLPASFLWTVHFVFPTLRRLHK